jgi:hypothetical protein
MVIASTNGEQTLRCSASLPGLANNLSIYHPRKIGARSSSSQTAKSANPAG